jgi:ubiquinone/menaquinone biosynthesis C-methylase UbiE
MPKTNGFTENADLYRTSLAHSELHDLESALEALPDLPGLSVLDIATGAGHTAFFFAQKHADTFAVDINEDMLRVAQEESDKRSLSIRFLKCPADDLMFDDETFDVASCRLAAHHFQDVDAFIAEVARVLRPGGTLLVIDNVVPDDDSETAQWLNRYERQRDPEHQVCLSASVWKERLEKHDFAVAQSDRFKKRLLFDPWMARMSKDDGTRDSLWQQLQSAPDSVLKYWDPKLDSENRRTVRLQRQILVATKVC